MISLYNKHGHYSPARDWADILLTITTYMTTYLILLTIVKQLTRMTL